MDNNTQTEPSAQNTEDSSPRSTAQNPPWSNQDIQSMIRDTVDKLIPRRSDEIIENDSFNRASTSRGSCSRGPYRRDSRSHSRNRTKKRNRSPSSDGEYSHNHSYHNDYNFIPMTPTLTTRKTVLAMTRDLSKTLGKAHPNL